MDDKVSDVFYDKENNKITFKILKVDKEINLNELMKNWQIFNIVFDEKTNNPKYIYGGGNIIFYINDKEGQKYVLRHSLSEKIKIENYRHEISKYYELSRFNIGVKIYYPSETNIPLYNDRYIIIEHYDKGSAISFFKTANPIVKKEKVIDKIFELIDSSIKNEIYCLDVKFRNFVVKLIGEKDVDVKMIDFEGCLLPIDSIISGNYLSMDNKKSVYKNIILIQVFYSCPIYLQSYYLYKLDIEDIIKVYSILQEEENLKNSLKLFSNLFFYYLKNEFFKSFFTFEKKILVEKKILDEKNCKLDDADNINIHQLLRIEKTKTLDLVFLFLYILFKQIVDLKFNYKQINEDGTKIEFNPKFKNEFINELLSKFKTYQDDDNESSYVESSDELCCLISDGKSIKRKKSKSKSIKRKKSKSIKRKKSKRKKKMILTNENFKI